MRRCQNEAKLAKPADNNNCEAKNWRHRSVRAREHNLLQSILLVNKRPGRPYGISSPRKRADSVGAKCVWISRGLARSMGRGSAESDRTPAGCDGGLWDITHFPEA